MENNSNTYDEDDALKFIRAMIPEEVGSKYDDDDIIFIIDCIWDYYESKGFLSLSNIETDDEELNIDDMVRYVEKAIKKDGKLIPDTADLKFIINAELEYEEALEDTIG